MIKTPRPSHQGQGVARAEHVAPGEAPREEVHVVHGLEGRRGGGE